MRLFVFWPHPLLAIESSCDETSAAVIQGRRILSHVVSTQEEMHAKYGGVIPEFAARAHVESILPCIKEALEGAGLEPKVVAVTNRPGLVGSLSVGITAAKAWAFAKGLPLIGIHHLEGHLFSVFDAEVCPELPQFPILSLIVSGGHTELVLMEDFGKYRLLGQTLDDAAGEAFDKGARLLGLGYPGGRSLSLLARSGNPKRYALPRGAAKDPFNFSFSGLKTAMLRLVEKEGASLDKADAAASLQKAIVDSLSSKLLNAWEEVSAPTISLVGGVSANQPLRDSVAEACRRRGVALCVPRPELSTDNAAMIGLAASHRLAVGERSDWSMDAIANDDLPGLR